MVEAYVPVAEAAAAGVEAHAPVVEAIAPVFEAAAPVVEAAESVVEFHAPAAEAAAPVLEALAPVAEAGAQPKVAEPPAEGASPPSALSQLLADFGKGANWSHLFTHDDKPHSASDKYAHGFETVDGTVCVRLSAGDATATSGGVTGGYNIRVPDELELAASGKSIKIGVIARSAGSSPTKFACAYSTCEVGNSGWMSRPVGPEWEVFSYDYNVGKMIVGNGDYVGLLPADAGEPAVDVAAIEITVIG